MRQLNLICFDEFPVLRTERLTLVPLTSEHAEEIFCWRSNPRVNQFIYRPALESRESAEELLAHVEKNYLNKEAIAWAAILRDGEKIIGSCGLNRIDKENFRAEIGGQLAPEYWGKNIALEAVRAIIKFAFDEMKLHAVEAVVAPENRGAIFLLETLGFVREGYFRDYVYFEEKFHDLAVYTLFE